LAFIPEKQQHFFPDAFSCSKSGTISRPESLPKRDKKLYQNGKQCFNGNIPKAVFFAPALAF